MIDNAFRTLVPRFAGPLLALYTRWGWTPDHVSVAGFVLALFAAAAVATEHPFLAIALWWISRLADGTDGVYARATGQEGLMLKRRDAPYTGGRPMGPWFKWKRDPLSADCVLVYAQRGHGKRSSFYSDYTFAAWRPGMYGD